MRVGLTPMEVARQVSTKTPTRLAIPRRSGLLCQA